MQSPWQAEIDQLCGQLGALEVNYLATRRKYLARLDELAPMSTAWAQAQTEPVAAMPVNIEPKAENE